MNFYPSTFEDLIKRYCWFKAVLSDTITEDFDHNNILSLNTSTKFDSSHFEKLIAFKSTIQHIREKLQEIDTLNDINIYLNDVWHSYRGIQNWIADQLVVDKPYGHIQIMEIVNEGINDTYYENEAFDESEDLKPTALELFGIYFKIQSEPDYNRMYQITSILTLQ